MAQRDDSKFSNRLEDAQKARAAMLEKAKARAEESRKKLQAGAGDRAAAIAAKEERAKQKAEEKRLAAERAVAEAKATEEARIKAEAEAKVEAAARKEQELLDHMARETEQKAARDARYAARKERGKKKR
jgi:hypothetical protein